MESSHIRVAIADDHPVIRLGIEGALADIPMLHLVGACSNSTDLIALLDTKACDVLVTDYAMPGGEHGDGLELITFLQHRYPAMAIVVLTGIDRPAVVQALLSQGIVNIVSKANDMTHLATAVHAAYVRRRYLSPALASWAAPAKRTRALPRLSPREREVLSLCVRGATITEIAERLQRSKQTVSTQKISGMAKLGIEKDADLFRHATELGLMADPDDTDTTG